jgi:hypothetical protein
MWLDRRGKRRGGRKKKTSMRDLPFRIRMSRKSRRG